MAISNMQQPQQIQGGIGSLGDPRQRYFLGKLVKKAKRLKLNRGSDINVWSFDALKLYPIVLSIPHNEGAEMRCQVALEDGSSVFLDILPKDFGKLKSVNIPA